MHVPATVAITSSQRLAHHVASSRAASRQGTYRLNVQARTKPGQFDEPEVERKVGFPYGQDGQRPQLTLAGRTVDADQAIQLMIPSILEERLKRIDSVLGSRTYSILPIIEHPADMGNLAACCRTADGLGCGAVHCIQDSTFYRQSARTSKGAEKWLDVRMWDNTEECLSAVRAAGYQVVVTHLSDAAVPINVDFTKKTAIVWGNEAAGVSRAALDVADVHAIIPMSGFVQSYNLSVALAIVLYEAQQQRLRRLGRHGDLTHDQQLLLKAVLMMKTVRHASSIISQLLDRPPPAFQEREAKRFDQASWKYGSGAHEG